MFILISENGSKAFYILNDKEYILGRKHCDFLIDDDKSISKRHTSFVVKNNQLEVTDLGSTYKTFINENELEPNKAISLKSGSKIKFGVLNSTYHVTEKTLLVCYSGLLEKEINTLETCIRKINGTLAKNWSTDCTHLTTDALVLTNKVLCTVIVGQLLVTLKFWIDFNKSINLQKPPPLEKDYRPEVSGPLLTGMSFDYKPERKTLFENKIFVFRNEREEKKIGNALELTGGKCVVYNSSITIDSFLKPKDEQYIMVKENRPSQQLPDQFDSLISKLEKHKIFPTYLQEISLSIINSSFEKYNSLSQPGLSQAASINPSRVTTQEQSKTTNIISKSQILALETPEGEFEPQNSLVTSTPIMDTMDVIEDSGLIIDIEQVKEKEKVGEKRLSEDDNSKEPKKRKIEIVKTNQMKKSVTNKITNYLSNDNVLIDATDENCELNASKRKTLESEVSQPSEKRFFLNPFATQAKTSQPNESLKKPNNKVSVTSPEEINERWVTKLEIKQEKDDNATPVDMLTHQFERSFLDSVVVQKESLVVERRRLEDITEDSVDSGQLNFKKFKKVRPLYVQSKIVSSDNYMNFVCNATMAK